MSGPGQPEVDLSRPRRVHIVGVGGGAMGAIASVLLAEGHQVSGSDQQASSGTERLIRAGARIEIGHRPPNVGEAELLAISTAVAATNPEVEEARRRGLPVYSRAQILRAITRLRRTVAVAGTHGKTTTSSMLALVLREAGWDPSFIIGGDIAGVGSGAAWRPGPWLVVEADESDGTFLDLDAEAVVVTSIEADHLDHYGTLDHLVAAFDRFLAQAPGPRLAYQDGPLSAAAAGRAGAITYGLAPSARYHVEDLALGRFDSSFRLVRDGSTVAELRLAVPGAHNAANAAAAAAMATELGVGRGAIEAGLAAFSGVARRFQRHGERDGVTYIDDYAHNPGKVRSVLAAAAAGGWDRIVCVFQPHRYSRTSSLWPDFADVFEAADVVVVTDVYPAGEAPMEGVTGRLIADAVLAAHPSTRLDYVDDRTQLAAHVRRLLRPGDLCLTLGAGDLNQLAAELMAGPA
ncbi:MAG TPA: UDP-N-acetylmuramate--L-alanine ligase [Acidimicrobiales bacterium]|nr:UDP-N-acetylmuramate--L-alanine ligase [Acidimicrobiales bacterium]